MPDLYTIRDVAKLKGVSKQTVQNWIHSGRLEATKIGNQLLIRQAHAKRVSKGEPGRPKGKKR